MGDKLLKNWNSVRVKTVVLGAAISILVGCSAAAPEAKVRGNPETATSGEIPATDEPATGRPATGKPASGRPAAGPPSRPAAAELVIPEEVYGSTPTEAVATVQLWADALSYGRQTGDYSVYDQITDSECAGCEIFRADYYTKFGEDAWSQGGASEAVIWGYEAENPDPATQIVYLDWVQYPDQVFDASGTFIGEQGHGTRLGIAMHLELREGQWVAVALEDISNENRVKITEGYEGLPLSVLTSQMSGAEHFNAVDDTSQIPETIDGARVALEYFFAALSEAYRTADTTEVAKLSGPDCTFCHHHMERAKEFASEGYSIEEFHLGAAVKTTLKAVGGGEQSAAFYTDLIWQGYQVTDEDGNIVVEAPGYVEPGVVFNVVYTDAGWVVEGISMVPLDEWLEQVKK